MPEVAPFQAIRYDFSRNTDLSSLIAPPYDVLDDADKAALLARSDRNIVAIDLPHTPPKSAGPPQAYRRSADLLQAWLTDRTLVREDRPALYLYHQVFEHEGRTYTRKKLIARVRLHLFEEGVILPHEQTFGGPKEDRLALMKATACNLSPVFGLYADPQGTIEKAFATVASTKPSAVGTLEDVQSRIWIVAEPPVIGTVVAAMADRRVFIADGHHRYDTALMYRDWVTGQHGGSLPPDHPANYVMFVLASMDDPGCLILPYHRALAGIDLSTLVEAWSDGCSSCNEADADLIAVDGSTGRRAPLKFTTRAVLKTLAPNQCEAWRALDMAYLHRYLIDELLHAGGRAGRGPDDPTVRFVKSQEAAMRTARDERGVALLVRATPMEHLRAVSEASELMPQKSTYFYPKLITGLTINPLL